MKCCLKTKNGCLKTQTKQPLSFGEIENPFSINRAANKKAVKFGDFNRSRDDRIAIKICTNCLL